MLNFKGNELSEINNENAYGFFTPITIKTMYYYNTLVLGVPIFLGTPNTTRWRPGDFTIEAVVSYPVCRDQWLIYTDKFSINPQITYFTNFRMGDNHMHFPIGNNDPSCYLGEKNYSRPKWKHIFFFFWAYNFA